MRPCKYIGAGYISDGGSQSRRHIARSRRAFARKVPVKDIVTRGYIQCVQSYLVGRLEKLTGVGKVHRDPALRGRVMVRVRTQRFSTMCKKTDLALYRYATLIRLQIRLRTRPARNKCESGMWVCENETISLPDGVSMRMAS